MIDRTILQGRSVLACNAVPLMFSALAGFEHFHGTIDPEELFRRIFGDAGMGGMGGMGGFGNFRDFEESKFGFAPASEVGIILIILKITDLHL